MKNIGYKGMRSVTKHIFGYSLTKFDRICQTAKHPVKFRMITIALFNLYSLLPCFIHSTVRLGEMETSNDKVEV